MHRLGVYRIRLPKQIFLRTPGSRSLRCDVTDGGGDGDGEGHFTRFVSRTLIHQMCICQRISPLLKTPAGPEKNALSLNPGSIQIIYKIVFNKGQGFSF